MMNERVKIIAEAGVNHNGSIDMAKRLIDIAADAHVDFVKFQTFKADMLLSEKTKKAEYQKNNTSADESQYAMIKKLELDENDHEEIIDYCSDVGVEFLSTGFDIESIDLLDKYDISFFKIPSGEITNLPYLRHVASKMKPIILSTGMSTEQDIEEALKILFNFGIDKDLVTVLHCNTEYPTPMKDVNLRAMISIQDRFNVKVGYSDHTLGIEVPIAAVALGAKVIEKHFTLDRALPGPDHAASLEPNELKEMVRGVRNIEKALGSEIKKPSISEQKNISLARKSIVAKRYISIGEKFTENNLSTKRPGTGISPMEWDKILNQKSKYNFEADDIIKI
jgi:N,N'-diacetyllegionaminate synthase